MSKLLAVDLDGTLFYPRKLTRRIPKKNVAFLRKWIDQGNKVVLVSSRSYEFTSQLKEEIQRPVDFINFIGGQVRINDELVKDVWIDREPLKKVLKETAENYDILSYMIATNDRLIMSNTKGIGKFFKFIYELWYSLQGKYREKYVIDNEIFNKQIEEELTYLVRIVFGLKKKNSIIAKELNKTLREQYPDIEFSWTDIIIEMSPKGCTKSESLNFYVEKTGFSKEDVYVVGDSGNDISMFEEYYEHSYCMAHSYSSVKKYAKHIISRVHNLDGLVLEGEK
ncbi:MAG: HAD family hydrolase [Bacilli bacterium]|nr:HAD family hydrolase [Bacilli bacterium]